jgi:hypothetical protein
MEKPNNACDDQVSEAIKEIVNPPDNLKNKIYPWRICPLVETFQNIYTGILRG